MELIFPADSPPLHVIAAAKIAGVSVVTNPTLASGSSPTLVLASGQKLHGANVILRYIGRISSLPEFYGRDAYQSSQIDEWLDYAPAFGLSIADVAVWAGLAGAGLRWESLRKSKKYQNLVRWFNSISAEYDAVLGEFSATYLGKKGSTKAATSKSKETQASSSQSTAVENGVHATETVANRAFEVDLPDAEVGKVKLRFAPEPSGYLHIGHSKAALLNQYFADRYNGQVIVRFDDTNPDKESSEFVDNLLKDIETLGIRYSVVTYTSNYFPQLMEMAEKLIREGPNKSLRDPVYYRCNLTPHHRIGSKYKIYPTYDFCCPFVDAVEGITHALRSSEYHDRNDQYYRIQNDMGFRKVHIYEFSRLNMVYTLLSKRKLLWFVQNGKVEGWDDPRFPTVQGIVRRGLKIEALIQFILEQNLNLMEDKLWAINKKIIDPVCPRHTAVIEERRVLLVLSDGPKDPFLVGVLHLDGNVKKTKLKLTWLSDTSELVRLTLVDFDYLITKKKLEEDEDFVDVVNPCTKKETLALGESDMRNLKRETASGSKMLELRSGRFLE
ncbi:hypothetical protein DH2020_026748 [Rehmannia glutinosa]|uniref:Glutamyl/glutaminyl-tRNA synthetase class Ib catalytic domain-containing protein n=1 Tax=Rehmannia glutinosa TaxID=99300 RepID=A0ABR0VW26_REHGL